MIQDLDKIKTLLATYPQMEAALGHVDKKGVCSYCIEGIFALTSNLIENRDLSSGFIYFNNPITEEAYESELDFDYYPAGVPDVVSFKLLIDNRDKLHLNKQQMSKLIRRFNTDGYDCISWIQLNDYIQLTFTQFSLLLDILNDTQLPD